MKPLYLLLLLGLVPVGAGAQPPTAQVAPFLTPWAELRYDPAERGPLLVVRPLLRKRPSSLSLNGYTEAFEGRVFPLGNLTVLAPRERTVLNTKPGKPNLFANMPPPERLKLFLGTCTEQQWRLLGSTGLGIREVTDDQKALFQSLLPVNPRLFEADVVAGDTPHSFSFKNTKSTPLAAESLKLQLALRNQYFFFEQGKREPSIGSGDSDLKVGGKVRQLEARFESRQEGGAFGQELFVREANQPKPSALSYDTLTQPVLLEGCTTVGEALARAAQATHLELHADKRVAPQSLYLRVAPGQSVAAGNLLQGLALGVTGTFRQLAPKAFLLTDDLDGIGSRWVRLAQWGQDADAARRALLDKAQNQKRPFDPTALIGFRADDTAALPQNLVGKLRSTWRQGGYSLTASPQTLPSGVQDDIQSKQQYWKDEGRALDDTRVEIRGAPRIGWVLPSGEYAGESLGGLTNGLGDTLIRDFAPHDTKPATPPSKPTPPAGFPVGLARYQVALSLTTVAEAGQAVREAKRVGATDLWIRVPPSTSNLEPLKATLAQGRTAGIAVGVLVPLLRDPQLGAPERTLTLQTGEAFAETLLQSTFLKEHPEYGGWWSRGYRGWRVLGPKDDATIEAFLKKLALLPGLAGLALKDTGGPGFAGQKSGGDGLQIGGEVGYTPERRLAFLRQEGYDPIDFGRYDYALQKTPELPFFPSREAAAGEARWFVFREDEVKARLTRFHRLVQANKPGLPLYLPDRVSDYADANTEWYGSWDSASTLPQNPVYAVRSEAMSAARKASKAIFLLYRRRIKGDPATFHTNLERVGKEALTDKWNGLWVDLSDQPPSDALSLLATLPRKSAP